MDGVSFIILTWNSEKYIYSCISSIYFIQGIDKEVIVIDNGSKDRTKEIIRNNFPDVTLIELDRNYGTTYTRNLGIKASNKNYNYICILDSDTIVNKDAVYKLIGCLKLDCKYMLAVPKMINQKGEMQLSAKRFPTIIIKLYKALPFKYFNLIGHRLEGVLIEENSNIIEVDYAISACWLMKREVIDLAGLLDENYFYAPEDVDYCATIWERGGKVILITDSLIIHDTQRISKRRVISKLNFLHIKGLIYFFLKHRYCLNAKKIRP